MSYLKKQPFIENEIQRFKLRKQTSKIVSEFYKSNPFPNYKVDDDKISIVQKGDKNVLAKQFKKFVGFNKKILEVGCGTGQLSVYFATGNNNLVISLDTTLESILVAKDFVKKNKIENIRFVNSDIFDDVLAENYFDFIWCNGVLHHTENPKVGFNIITKSLKKDGYILVGLYNKFGRLRTIIRRFFYKIFGTSFVALFDPTLKKLKLSKDEQISWIRDQYQHPKESLHTLDEVLDWFKKNNIEFISSIPSCDMDNDFNNIFYKKLKGNLISRFLNQVLMIFDNLGSDGGLFIVIGKKNG